jgi:hypothetical protein
MDTFFELLNAGDREAAVQLMAENAEMRIHVGDSAQTLRGVDRVGGWFLRGDAGLRMIPGDVRDTGNTYEADLLVHDEQAEEPYLALMLSRMFWPDYPVPVGVLRAVARPTHDQLIADRCLELLASHDFQGTLRDILQQEDGIWECFDDEPVDRDGAPIKACRIGIELRDDGMGVRRRSIRVLRERGQSGCHGGNQGRYPDCLAHQVAPARRRTSKASTMSAAARLPLANECNASS